MSHHVPHSDDPKVQAYIEKITKRDRRTEHFFRRALHVIERIIAVITILALLGALGMEVIHMLSTGAHYFEDVNHMLHNLLTIVVGLEFVRMLIDTTPSNILEVLTVAITRHVVRCHENPWANVASIGCIAALIAVRRYLIRRSELKEELVEVD